MYNGIGRIHLSLKQQVCLLPLIVSNLDGDSDQTRCDNFGNVSLWELLKCNLCTKNALSVQPGKNCTSSSRKCGIKSCQKIKKLISQTVLHFFSSLKYFFFNQHFSISQLKVMGKSALQGLCLELPLCSTIIQTCSVLKPSRPIHFQKPQDKAKCWESD